jgi:hypothetical protein
VTIEREALGAAIANLAILLHHGHRRRWTLKRDWRYLWLRKTLVVESDAEFIERMRSEIS